jgi:hypothetical protein
MARLGRVMALQGQLTEAFQGQRRSLQGRALCRCQGTAAVQRLQQGGIGQHQPVAGYGARQQQLFLQSGLPAR